MQLTIDRDDLLPALQAAAAVASRATNPDERWVVLDSRQAGLAVHAGDLTTWVRTYVRTEAITERGVAAVDAKAFARMIGSLPRQHLAVSLAGGYLEVRSTPGVRKNFQVRFKTIAEWLEFPTAFSATPVEVDAGFLLWSLSRVAFAASDDQARENLCGVNVVIRAGSIRTDATDGHRLAKSTSISPGIKPGTGDMLIPVTGARTIMQALANASGTVKLAATEHLLGVWCAPWVPGEITLKLSRAKFPPTDQVIPARGDAYVELDRAATIEALTQARLMGPPTTTAVELAALARRESLGETCEADLRIKTESAERGSASIVIDAVVAGTVPAVRVNADYMIQALAVIPGEGARLYITNELQPILVVPVDDAVGLELVVMPMR
ncbi:MAG TPA: DNA polymerase III subunit beta [Acidimicrobiia bacterium]